MKGGPMAAARDALRDWHRLFGLLLTDFFTGLPFTVKVERDLIWSVGWRDCTAIAHHLVSG